MAYTQADLDRLDAAIATEELEVEVAGQRTRYRSISELRDARAHVAGVRAQAKQATQGRGGAVFRYTFTTQRGF